jgi:hypothetical protein
MLIAGGSPILFLIFNLGYIQLLSIGLLACLE